MPRRSRALGVAVQGDDAGPLVGDRVDTGSPLTVMAGCQPQLGMATARVKSASSAAGVTARFGVVAAKVDDLKAGTAGHGRSHEGLRP
ncbi:hypothetical protein ETD86_13410 [Nonomuraea turkmeniaca]|uniref:Uncharacterized protein n=1 Tax=Nonomuraea turkmeniaca TaxID=103838 RepID=A0A5S4FMN8_9ACTN|nr:hypothetical protein [Nonomuraea turkmeniaca]TMR21915.1 hypothetical protein ETD86_13410 [Nonomuraea turkmeniaca]